MASRKDYEMIAAQLTLMRERALTHREKTMLTELASRLASGFRMSEPTFNTDRFLQAAHAYEET